MFSSRAGRQYSLEQAPGSDHLASVLCATTYSCVSLGRTLTLTKPQVPYLRNGNSNSCYYWVVVRIK